MSGSMAIAAVVAAFNEESTIGEVVTGALAHVAAVFVVSDGSEDRTAEVAAAAGARVAAHDRNRGKGQAVRTGLALALAEPYTHVLLLDGDLQHRPADIPALVAAAREPGVDVVVGARVFDRATMPAARYYTNVLGSRALSGLIGAPVSDSQSGFRLFAAAVLRDLPLTASGYEIETEMLIRLARRGARMVEVPVTVSYDGYRGASCAPCATRRGRACWPCTTGFCADDSGRFARLQCPPLAGPYPRARSVRLFSRTLRRLVFSRSSCSCPGPGHKAGHYVTRVTLYLRVSTIC